MARITYNLDASSLFLSKCNVFPQNSSSHHKTKKQCWRTSGVLYTQPRRNGGGGTGVAIGTKPRWVRVDDFPEQLFSDIKNLKYSAGAPFECCIHNRVSTTRDAEMGGGQG